MGFILGGTNLNNLFERLITPSGDTYLVVHLFAIILSVLSIVADSNHLDYCTYIKIKGIHFNQQVFFKLKRY